MTRLRAALADFAADVANAVLCVLVGWLPDPELIESIGDCPGN